MEGTREKALVGIFVLVAVALLFGVTMALTGGIGVSRVPHSTYFRFSGGLESGAPVRYAGLNIGKITRVHVDPSDTTRIEIDFAVDPDTPIRTDSVARVSSMGLLSDNFLEISPGTSSAAKAAPGSIVKSREAFGFDQIGDAVEAMLPDGQAALKSLNADLDTLRTTIGEANDLLNEKNRANLAGTLSNLNGTLADVRPALNQTLTSANQTLKSLDQMLADAQPKIGATLTNVQALTTKLDPLLDDLNKTVGTANNALTHVDSTVGENREDIRASVASLRQVLEKATVLVGQLNSTLTENSDDIDETLDNVRLATENLRQLTDTLKTSPTSIIRGTGVKDRKPGSLPK
ncbi:MAG: MlaD family protein [Bryobacteraceae bacterium]|jgi:virulence factor Mce-like protein